MKKKDKVKGKKKDKKEKITTEEAVKETKKVTKAKTKSSEKKKATKKSAKELDKFGFGVGSKRSVVAEKLSTGKFTPMEAAKGISTNGKAVLEIMKKRGFKVVEKKDGKVKVLSKKAA